MFKYPVDKTGKTNDFFIKQETSKQMSVVHICFVPRKDMKVTFGLLADINIAISFSEEPLKGNPDDDKAKLM